MSNEKVLVNKDDLVSLANSVRTKSGTTDEMTLTQMKTKIDNIPLVVETNSDVIYVSRIQTKISVEEVV